MRLIKLLLIFLYATVSFSNAADSPNKALQMLDIFELELASDPQISTDGKSIVYVRNFMDIMQDQRRSNLWWLTSDGKNHRPLTSGLVNDSSPRFSPDGKRLAYVSTRNGSPQIFIRWLDTDREHQVAQLQFSPSSLTWSPNGKWLAFSLFVPEKPVSLGVMPTAPKDAKWAKPAKIIDNVVYRADGAGYIKAGYSHLFVVPSDGGTPRQITQGEFHHRGKLTWMPDSKHLIFSANRHDNWRRDITNSEIYRVNVHTNSLKQLTTRVGPDNNPVVSPNGKWIAFTGFDDKYQGYQITQLYVMKTDGSNIKLLSKSLDRDVQNPQWMANSRHIYFQYDDKGDTKVVKTDLNGKRKGVAKNLGGTSFGRPYGGGSFSVSHSGAIAYTWNSTQRLAEIAFVSQAGKKPKKLTNLNGDILDYRQLASVEEIKANSSYDKQPIQGWLVKPADFDPAKKHPLILEIHGGPFANYGVRFSPEMQLYAAAGYMVLYTNPRGSTSYGKKFGNAIHHDYPGNDYDDLMTMVDAAIAKGNVNEKQLFVTGGSGGGVLTSWIVGKTDRFAAAVVAKPVINWISFVLTADMSPYFTKYWFKKMPWEDHESYWKRSPLSLVGNVVTPTMLLTGEADYRTPMSETEQYYQALKLRGIDTMMVRIPDASHGITKRPSNLIAKVSHILAWFEKYRGK